MGPNQHKLVLLALLVSESAWIFVVVGAISVVTEHGPSPVSWPAILMIMGFSMFSSHVGRIKLKSTDLTPATRVLLGGTMIYLTVAFQVSTVPGILDLAWVTRFGSSASEGFSFEAVINSVTGVVVWWRGGRVGAVESPVLSLRSSFQFGLLAFAVSTVVDIAATDKIHVFPMVFVFFASGLVGLSIGNVLPESQESSPSAAWPKIITGTVTSIVLVGLLLMFINRDVLTTVAKPFQLALGILLTGIVWVVFVPIAYIFNLIHEFLISTFNPNVDESIWRSDNEEPEPLSDYPFEDFGEVPSEADWAFLDFMQVVEWALITLFVFSLLAILVVVFKRVSYRGRSGPVLHKESVIEDADLMEDSKKLLVKLLPAWMRRRAVATGYGNPEGPPGIVDPIILYYHLLEMAESTGVVRGLHETPTEFEKSLSKVFPVDLVRMATSAFNRALYGNDSTPEEDIATMKSAIRSTGKLGSSYSLK